MQELPQPGVPKKDPVWHLYMCCTMLCILLNILGGLLQWSVGRMDVVLLLHSPFGLKKILTLWNLDPLGTLEGIKEKPKNSKRRLVRFSGFCRLVVFIHVSPNHHFLSVLIVSMYMHGFQMLLV